MPTFYFSIKYQTILNNTNRFNPHTYNLRRRRYNNNDDTMMVIMVYRDWNYGTGIINNNKKERR